MTPLQIAGVVLVWLGVAGAIFGGWYLWRRGKREAAFDVLEFARVFPGRCLVCSYHRYGVGNGFIDPDQPVGDHHCLEDQRWK